MQNTRSLEPNILQNLGRIIIPQESPAVLVQHIKNQGGQLKSNALREVNAQFIFDGFDKMHVKTVTQPGVTQTPKNCLEFTFFRGDQENSFYLQNRKID